MQKQSLIIGDQLQLLKRLFGKKFVAFLIDGPNIVRKGMSINFDKIRAQLSRYGELVIQRVYLDQHATDKLIEAMINQGFDVRITSGDVDVTMAVDATELALSDDIDVIVFMTRDMDYIPAIIKAKRKGKKVIVVAPTKGLASALKHHADEVLLIPGNPEKAKR